MGINVSKDDENGKVDELVEMIDKLMSDGTGSLVIDIDSNSDKIKVSTVGSRDCGNRQTACAQPNEPDEDLD